MNLKGLTVDQMFTIGAKVIETAPTAADAAAKDVQEQFGIELPNEATRGLMVCGMVLFLTVMQKVAEAKEAK